MDVLFKRGSQAAIETLISTANSATEGSFYLTEDTNRLYIGKNISTTSTADVRPVAVNQGVINVASVANLPALDSTEMGQFYYCAAENVLCVLSGKPGLARWVQINPDTNTSIKTHTIGVSTTSGVATVTSTITEKISTGGSVSDGDTYDPSFTLQGDNGIDVSNTGNAITIEGEKNTLQVAAGTGVSADKSATVTLTSDKFDTTAGDRNSVVTFAGGTDMKVTVSGNTITYSFDGKDIGDADLIISNGDVDTAGSTVGFTITLDDDTNSTHGYFDPTIQIGDHSDALIHFDGGKATLPVYTKDEVDDKIHDFDAMSYKGTIGSTGTYTAVDLGGTATSGVLTEAHNGDTFKVSGSLSGPGLTGKFVDAEGKIYGVVDGNSDYNQIQLKAGDLLIMQGTELADGTLDPTTVWFDYVPSANDYDTQYTGYTVDNGIEFKEKTSNAPLGGIKLVASTDNNSITITDNTNPGTTNVTNTVTIKHKENFQATGSMVPAGDTAHVPVGADGYTMQRATGTSNSELDIQVPQFTWDKGGHLASVSYVTYKVVDTYGAGGSVIDYKAENITSTTPNAAAPSFLASADLTVVSEAADGTQTSKTLKLKSDTLAMSLDGTKNLKINLVWGTF